MTGLTDGVEKEILRRFEEYASPEIRAEYSIESLSSVIGNDILIDALLSGKRIKKCKCCGMPFVTNGKGRECYCNRSYDGRRTCKDVGPALSRNSDPVTKEMDRARRLHLWRRSRNGKTEAACRRYEEWLSFAQEKENACRIGTLSLDELRRLIGPEYRNDFVEMGQGKKGDTER